MNKNILITSAGRRVSLVKAFQRELKKFFPQGKIFTVDAKPELSAACAVSDKYFKVPRLNNDSYIDSLLNICVKNSVGMIVPTIDTELIILANNRKLFESKNIKVIISDEDFIKICRDKRLTHQFFRDVGIDVAMEFSKSSYKLPLFIKPIDGSRSIDNYIITSKNELQDYHFKNEKLMFLEYLNHNEYTEYTCDLYYGKDNMLKCVIPRKRIEVRDGEVNKGKTEKNVLVPLLKDKLNKIEGAIGCLTIQFFKHNNIDRIVGIEINPRFGGGFPLSYLAGGNFPAWLIKEYFLNKDISYFERWEDNLLMLRYDDEILIHNHNE